jgi:hypothetical protein
MSSVRSAAQLYLPGVEAHHQAGPYQKLIDDAKGRGDEYSKIWDLFAECAFCTRAHAAAAAELLGDEALVWKVLRDLESSPLPEQDKLLLRFVGKVTKNLPAITSEDVGALQAAGWDDEAIYYAITTCALFNFYNRWITATGVPEMSEEVHRRQGKMLASRGYSRD